MSLARWNRPLRDMAAMQNVMDRVFYDAFRPVLEQAEQEFNSTIALDVFESAQGYTVYASIPGGSPEAIEIKFENDVLQLWTEIPAPPVQAEDTRALLLERVSGRFSRQLQLPQPVDVDQAQANYENGVLTLTLPKSPESQPRVLRINTRNGTGTNS